jgi:chromosome segregation ATPase
MTQTHEDLKRENKKGKDRLAEALSHKDQLEAQISDLEKILATISEKNQALKAKLSAKNDELANLQRATESERL